MQLLIQSVLLVLSGAMDLIRSALCVLASEDTGAKRSMLPVAWVGAVLMAAAVVLGMPEEAHADYCWSAWDCNLDTTPKIDCDWWCDYECDTYSAGCVKYGSSGRYRCRCGCP